MSTNFAIDAQSLSKIYELNHEKSSGKNGGLSSILHLRARPVIEKFEVLKKISFSVERGDSFAIFGGNGAGKTSLLQLIAGTIPLTSGRLDVEGNVAPLIELGVGFEIDLTGEQNIYLQASLYGKKNAYTYSIFDEIVEFSGLRKFIDIPVKTYSLGMYMRLAFSIAVHMKPDILLADEILGVGDSEFFEKCVAKIRDLHKAGMTLILVTHSILHAKSVCRRFMVLDNGRICDQGLLAER